MLFTVKHTELLKLRNKFASPCNPDWKNDDENIMQEIITRVGCRPPHWKIHSNLVAQEILAPDFLAVKNYLKHKNEIFTTVYSNCIGSIPR